ncbi:hypothetical protein GCM10011396_38240 [Undibacterium terreum]|uniref:RHS repeat-associated core domain-containing protein n=1 Tax=Undibacterium terreum TaxID=1224302 RepID=A0A916UUG9_9BURK|nr:hypothetical protein GCM10011396_38240 [Undibacterium terreum]
MSINYTASLPAGTYRYKLRSTDDGQNETDTTPVIVNITDSALLGTVSGVRTNAIGNPELVGWTCQDGISQGLVYSVYLDSPPALGGTLLTSGIANIATELDNATVQAQCHTPGAGHHFVVDLSSYTGANVGKSIYVQAQTGNGGTIILPCADNNCTMPGSLRIALTTPANGDRYTAPATVFARAVLSNGTGPYDEIAFNINGVWIPGQADTAAGAYFASLANLQSSSTPYIVYAKVRQGSTTIYSVQNQIYVDSSSGVSLSLTAPSNGTTLSMATPILLSATSSLQSGSSITLASVKFYANGTQIATGTNSNGIWSAQWIAAQSGNTAIIAKAFDGSGVQLAQSGVSTITISAGTGPSSSTPLPVSITPPHLGNPDAGTLAGTLSVDNDGASTFSLPLVVPSGPGGMMPTLSLNYSSQASNGMVGLGWTLGGLSTIHRCAKTIAQDGVPGRINFTNSDRLCLDGQRLVRVDGTAPAANTTQYDDYYWATTAEFRTEQESFTRITRTSIGFTAEFKDGKTHYYGNTSNSVILASGRPGSDVLLWALGNISDRSGNFITVEYNQDATTGEYTPKQIRYGGFSGSIRSDVDLAVRFVYEVRPDAQIQYFGGARNDLRTRLINIQTYTGTAVNGSGGSLVRDHIIHYTTSATSGRSLVDWMQACSINPNTQVSECLPKTTFDWGKGTNPSWKSVPFDSQPWPTFTQGATQRFEGNLDGSGRTSFISVQDQGSYFTGTLRIRLPNGQIFDRNINLNSTPTKQLFIGDLDGDGRDDLVFGFPGVPGGLYCLSVPLSDGTVDFNCAPLPNNLIDTMVDLRNEKRMHLVSFNQSGFTDCSLVNGSVTCTTKPVSGQVPPWNPNPQYIPQPIPVDLSKHDVSDFYRLYSTEEPALDPAHPNVPFCSQISGPCDVIAYVNSCINSSNGLACNNITRLRADAGANGPFLSKTAIIGDVNGDGLTDFIYKTYNNGSQRSVPVPAGGYSVGNDLNMTTFVCLSSETGMDCKQDTGINAYSLTAFDPERLATDANRSTLADLTGDGVNRLFFTYKPNPPDVDSAKSVLCRYTINGFSCQEFAYSEAGGQYAKLVYLDDSGIPTFMAFDIRRPSGVPNNTWSASNLADSPAVDKIVGVTNGIGQRDEVDYARGDSPGVYSRFVQINGVAQRPTYPQVSRSPGVIVKELRRSTGNGNWIRSDYHYEGALSDATGRGSLGFGLVRVTDIRPNGNIVNTSLLAQTYPFTGMLTHSTSVYGGTVLNDTSNTLSQQLLPQSNGSSTVLAHVSHTDQLHNDLNGSSLGTTTIENAYTDGWGNLTQQTTTMSGGGKTFSTQTTTAFNNIVSDTWLIGLPNTVVTTKSDSETGNASRNTSFTYFAGTPLLQTETVEANTSRQVITTYARHKTGWETTKSQSWIDPNTQQLSGRILSDTSYDSKGRFPVLVKNALGQSETRSYYAGTGIQKSLTGPNNLTTSWLADGFGRISGEQRADGTYDLLYQKQCSSDCPPYATVAIIKDTFGGGANFAGGSRMRVPLIVYNDSANHVVRNMTWGFDGSPIYKDQTYDSQGQLSDSYQSRFGTGNSYLERHQEYDDLQRITKVTTFDEGGQPQYTATNYQGLVNVVTNPKLQQRTNTLDVLGRAVQVVDSMSGSTNFRYEPFGNLNYTKDPNGNEISVLYDNLGRRTDLNDPDLGHIHYDVDPLGRTWRQVTPNQRAQSKATTFEFDALDRMVARHESDLESRWIYDAAAKGIGSLTEAYTFILGSSTKDYDRVHTYDSLGRPSLITQLINGYSFTNLPEYDIWGRLIRNTYQRASDTAKVYDSRYNGTGYLARIERGAQVLWQVLSQDAAQRITSALLGNGLTDFRGYNVYSGRLENGSVQTTTNTTRVLESYHYDAIGNVTQRSQYWDNGGFDESFSYDGLNRLSTSQVGSKPLLNFNYDAAGNLKTKTDLGTYTYPSQGSGSALPHAVSSISGIPGTFSYDSNGNLLSGASRTATWTSFDMPLQINRNGNSESFVYGPEHQRTRQNRGDGSTLVYAGAQEVETKTGITTIKTYWPFGLGVEIDRGASATEFDWFHKDRLGSPIAISAADGTLSEKLAYDAWGRRRTLDGSGPLDITAPHVDNKGFTGHEMLDQVELVHMNGRVYDPIVGRFVSGDPFIQDATNGQNYNRYSYVLNNPTNLTDPTGFWDEPPEDWLQQDGWRKTIYMSDKRYQEALDREKKSGDDKGKANNRDITQGPESKQNPRYSQATDNGTKNWTDGETRNMTGSQVVNSIIDGVKGDPLYQTVASIVITGKKLSIDAYNWAWGDAHDSALAKQDLWANKIQYANSIMALGMMGRGGMASAKNYFRGAKSGTNPSFVPKPGEYKVDPVTGFVKDTHGVSVFNNAESVLSKGYDPYQVDLKSMPDSLRIIQRGADPYHFEITPKPGANLTPQEYINACTSIVCK